MNEQLGFGREKSKNLLLPSQISIMKDIYEEMDTHKDHILRRSDFIMQLRTNERVVSFID